MAKSWGARIVGLLFGSRSHKKADAEGDETPTLEDSIKDILLQHDSEPYEEPSTKNSDELSDQIRPGDSEEPAPTKGTPKAQLNVGKPHTLKMPTLSVEPAKENADEPPTPVSNSAPMRKPSPVRVPKSQSGRLADKASVVGEGTATGVTSIGQSVDSDGGPKKKPDRGAQRKVTNKVPTIVRSKADTKVPTDIKPDDRADELVSAKDIVSPLVPSSDSGSLKFRRGREKKSATPGAEFSPMKRSGTQKPKVMDEYVTDEELAELEAENARLKILLSEKLSSKFSS